MGGGGSVTVEETESEKAQAEVAESMWELYQQKLAPYEDVFISNIEKMNQPGAYKKAAGDTNMAYSSKFSDARDQASDSMVTAGVNPNSGKFDTAQDSLTRQQAFSQNDAMNQAQSSNADQYVGGLEDALAIGAGEQAQNMQAVDSLASASSKAAAADARAAESNVLSSKSEVGSLIGAGMSAGMMGLGSYNLSKKANPYS